MQTANVNLPINVTGRHISITDAIRDYARKKVEGLHLDYPRIIEARVILDVANKTRQMSEILLFCANHITIEASTESDDMYKSIDETISKIARRMRKHKTRLLKTHRPRNATIRHFDEQVFRPDMPEDHELEVEPYFIHQENYRVRPLFPDEAIMDMELSERSFVIFHNAKTDQLCVLYRRKDGDYGVIEVHDPVAKNHS